MGARTRKVSAVRAKIAYQLSHEFGISRAEIAHQLGVCTSAIAKALQYMVGSSLDDLRNFPDEARRAAGFELRAVQSGLEPSDWKPKQVIGSGVNEIHIHVLGE